MDSPIPEKKEYARPSLLGLAFEKGKALQHKVLFPEEKETAFQGWWPRARVGKG